MMADLEPSVEVTGGPWYTDNELDTEFIKMLKTACLQYIRDRVRFSHEPKISCTR
jgi:DNA-directed RNA polymerase III subunit RPC6